MGVINTAVAARGCRFGRVSRVVEMNPLIRGRLRPDVCLEEAMRYALLIYTAPEVGAHAEAEADAVASPAEAGPKDDGVFDSYLDYTRALKSAGALVALERLQEVETATSVRLRGGERLLTDGPFIETKEHLIGFYLIEAPDLDTALDWAARMPHMRHGVVEVRPAVPTPALAEIVAE